MRLGLFGVLSHLISLFTVVLMFSFIGNQPVVGALVVGFSLGTLANLLLAIDTYGGNK